MTISTDTTLLHDPRRQASLLYWQGFSVPQIAEMLQVKRPTVQSWKQRDGWDGIAPISRVESSLEARLIQLIVKPQKSGGDFKEIDLLGRQIERLARVNRYSQTGNEVDLNPNVANRNKGERKKPKKNFFSDEAIAKLEEIFFDQSFEYQLQWYRAGLAHRIRDILKSRQIGATFYFSREALLRALKTGHNQIFLSASKTQAYVFREYIIQFARLVDVDLTGDPIVIGNNGAKLIFSAPIPTRRRAITATCMSTKFSGSRTFSGCAKSPRVWPRKNTCAQPIFRRPPRWRMALTPSGLASCSTRGAAVSPSVSISISAIPRSPVVSSATMDSGGRLSPLRTRLPVAARCLTLTSSNAKTAQKTLKTCLCANLSTTKRRCSRSRSCSAAWST